MPKSQRPRVSTRVMCPETEKHDSHYHPVTLEYYCAGQVGCGVRVHEAHQYMVDVDAFCHGICNCGMGRGVHGPGEHK